MIRATQHEYLTKPNAGTTIAKVVTPANFQRTFQQVNEAVALSLFDGSLTDLQLLMQTFCRFIFQQLQSEYDQEFSRQRERSNATTTSAMEHVFGHSVVTSTTFLHSGTVEVGVTNRAFAIDLVYPNVSKGGLRSSFIKDSTTFQPFSFANILWGSLQKESHMRGWCQASGNLEPFKQVRSITSLPRILAVQCGDTQRDPKETTISGALGETIAIGNMHQHFWSRRNSLGGAWMPEAIEIAIQRSQPGDGGKQTVLKLVVSTLQIVGKTNMTEGKTESSPSMQEPAKDNDQVQDKDQDKNADPVQRVQDDCENQKKNSQNLWVVFDGKGEISSESPASTIDSYGIKNGEDGWEVARFGLLSVISLVDTPDASGSNDSVRHVVLHMKSTIATFDEQRRSKETPIPVDGEISKTPPSWNWYALNDFCVSTCSIEDATTFQEWRHPCLIFFSRTDYEESCLAPCKASEDFPAVDFDTATVPSSVLQLPSLSQVSCIRISPLLPMPGKGDLVAFDGEFVSVEAERAEVNKEGQRFVSDEGRQVLARISIVDGGSAEAKAAAEGLSTTSPSATSVAAAAAAAATAAAVGATPAPPIPTPASQQGRPMRVLADDYILPSEAVVDYVTRFSGITAEDLAPATTRHALVSNRTAYLKLRFFLDRGCIFVGHGLQKDFETANVFVSPDQIIDTVELWRLQNQRKISLRFLASHVLKADIQDGIHDSIEDAKTALSLYRHYESVVAQGQDVLNGKLQALYDIGNRTNWFTVGLSPFPSLPKT